MKLPDQLTSALCVKCQVPSSGQTYPFFFGNKIGQSDRHLFAMPGQQRIEITTTYSIRGQDGAFVCNSCVRSYKRRHWLAFLIFFPASIVLLVFAYFVWNRTGESPIRIVSLVAGLLGGVGFFVAVGESLKYFFEERGEVGSIIARDSLYDDFSANGFDSLFTPREIRHMKKKGKV